MPNTLGGPDYLERIAYQQSNFYSSSLRDDGQTTVMHALVGYNLMLPFEQTMKGYSFWDGALIRRYPPQPHYQRNWLYVKQVDYVREVSEPTQDANGNLNYTDLLANGQLGPNGQGQVELAVTYEVPEGGALYLPDSQRPGGRTDELWRFISRRIEQEVTSQQLPKQALAYAAHSSKANDPLPAVGSIVIATATIYYTTFFPAAAPASPTLPGNLETHVASGIGTINSVTFDGKYPPYTLLCLAPKRELVWQSNGTPAVRMTYVFAQRGTVDVSGSDADSMTPDWTRILNGSATNNIFSRINRVGQPTKFAYNTSDFVQLFTP